MMKTDSEPLHKLWGNYLSAITAPEQKVIPRAQFTGRVYVLVAMTMRSEPPRCAALFWALIAL